MTTSISISVKGGKATTQAIKAIAAMRGYPTMAEYVREVLARDGGEDFHSLEARFAAESDGIIHHAMVTSNDQPTE